MLRIVIVEDEDIIRMGLIQTVDWQSMGAEVIGEAADGAAGLEVIRALEPDVVLTDIRMPRMSGLAMARELAEGQVDIRLVFLTSYAEFEYARQAVKLQAADYLLKPVSEDELAKVLARIAHERRLHRTGEDGQAEWLDLGLVDWLEILQHEGLNVHVRRVLEKIAADYQEHIGIEDIAEQLQVSPSYLSRKLKEATGHTFGGLLARYRLQKAVVLLAEGSYKAYEVAEHTGFGEYKVFCQAFKKYLHESPKRFMLNRELKQQKS